MNRWPTDDDRIDHDRACEHYAWVAFQAIAFDEGIDSDNTWRALAAWIEANRILAERDG